MPVIQSLLKKPQMLSGPRKETSSDLKNNNVLGTIILKPALIFCAKSVGFYWILVLILVKSTATSLKCGSMFNVCSNFLFPLY